MGNIDQDYFGMVSWRDAWKQEQEFRKSINPQKLCNFGIKSLDDALTSFLPNDLIVLGADSGAGKSHVCLDIALHNAQMGRNVGLYFIEGNDHEAITRIKWRMLKNIYYASGKNGLDLDFKKWRMNLLNLDDVEEEALSDITDKVLDRLQMYHAKETFTLQDFKNSIGWFIKREPNQWGLDNFKYDVDLLIIDHIQYFTLTNPKNEYSEMSEILKTVKNITDFHKIPVLLVSHLRKKEKDRGLPSQEDFFGTSNIAKICSEAITISPCYTNESNSYGIFPTFFRFVKSRTPQLKPNFAILNNFNLGKGGYEDDYKLIHLKVNQPGDEFKPYELPKWAKKNKPEFED
jgi:replicative DNA helicase